MHHVPSAHGEKAADYTDTLATSWVDQTGHPTRIPSDCGWQGVSTGTLDPACRGSHKEVKRPPPTKPPGIVRQACRHPHCRLAGTTKLGFISGY